MNLFDNFIEDYIVEKNKRIENYFFDAAIVGLFILIIIAEIVT